ncbi:uncharacterized protein LOC143004879 [Genypterus blacodes]|uniref:uncharacterized protein LOC143004879 n=1 Tax=Genypterus blacodes TaxID=154954 RepID=UPI003F775849
MWDLRQRPLCPDNFLPADISVSGPPAVSEGDDITFRCTVSPPLQTACGSQPILSYLRKNETILQVQPFNVEQREATFTIQGAVRRDSGQYSCVVLPSKCIDGQEEKLHGNNTVFIEVKEIVLRGLAYYAMVSLVVILLLCFIMWINKRGLGSFHKLRGLCQMENLTVAAAPSAPEEELETPTSSFSSEEEEGYADSEFIDTVAHNSQREEQEDPYHTIDDTLDNGQGTENLPDQLWNSSRES